VRVCGSGGGRDHVLLASLFCPTIPHTKVQVYFCGLPLTHKALCFRAKFPVLGWDGVLASQSYSADLSYQVGFGFRQHSR